MRNSILNRFLAPFLLVGCLVGSAAQAQNVLQLYIEGANYDTDSETWVTGSNSFRLWVIGNVDQHGPILDVKLAAAYATGEVGTITLTPVKTLLLADPSLPIAPVLNNAVGGNGTNPIMSDGHALPDHGIYGDGTSFKQWALGDFDKYDSPIGDFQYGFPGSFPSNGQINAYDVKIDGYTMVHFDAFNHVEGFNHAFKAPFSHDASTEVIPEPGTLVLLGSGLLGSSLFWRRRRARH